MNFLDIVLGFLLLYAAYKGIKRGLFVELASLISLVVGVFVAIKFSYLLVSVISGYVLWSVKYIQITAFGLTFLLVIITIHTLAKVFTLIANFAYLGWINKLGGAVFSVLKTVLALSIIINLFQKININNILVKKESLDKSIFFNPIKDVSAFIYPSLNKLYNEVKTHSKDLNLDK